MQGIGLEIKILIVLWFAVKGVSLPRPIECSTVERVEKEAPNESAVSKIFRRLLFLQSSHSGSENAVTRCVGL
jgi:hypothetical protein